jgi:thiol-disulfide isomerase/thioredoxin
MRLIPILCAVLAIAGCDKAEQAKPTAANEAAAAAPAGPTKGVDRSHKGNPAPTASFNDPNGQPVTLAAYGGKPLLVNLWASWCAPCVKELPTLDRLLEKSDKVQVLAVSQDTGPHASVVAFLQSRRVARLDAYQDPKMALSGALGAEVLPTSVLYDGQGREVWRYVGDLDWTGPEAAKLLSESGGGTG